MGTVSVPDNSYYGAQTQRAIDNFNVSGIMLSDAMIKALGMIKKSAAIVNCNLGLLDSDRRDAIIKAADEVIDGKFNDQFLIDKSIIFDTKKIFKKKYFKDILKKFLKKNY